MIAIHCLLAGVSALTIWSCRAQQMVVHHHGQQRYINNGTIAGQRAGCKHMTTYFINPVVKFPMCIGQSPQDLKNGMSIINLIGSRGYLPTCRVMQLMLWMASSVMEKGISTKDYFVDIGANIGKLSTNLLLVERSSSL